MRRLATLVAALLALVMGVSGAAQAKDPAAGKGKPYRFCWIVTSNVDESMKWFTVNAQKKAKELGVTLDAFDPNGDIQKQVNMIEDAIASRYDAVLFIPLDREALVPAAKKAKEAGLVVVTWSSDLAAAGQKYRDFFIGPNDTEAGELAAKAVIKAFPAGAKGVMVMGGPGEDAQVKRETGFENGLKGSKITLLGKQACEGWDPAKALTNMEDFLTKYGKDIKFVYSHWDNGSTAIVEAIQARGLKDVFIVSVDGCREGFRLVKEGKINSTIYQNMAKHAGIAVEGALDVLKTGAYKNKSMSPAGEIFDPWTLITKDNANFDPGW